QSSAVDLKTKEEKDAELDRRIEALRKKNEALVKRYQEIEEDKKKAELEGIAVTTPRKPRLNDTEADRGRTEKENLTVTVELSKQTGEKRIVNDWKPSVPRGRKTSEDSDTHGGQSEGQSPPRRKGSGRLGRGGQRGGGGRQERREREPRTPRTGENGEPVGQGPRSGIDRKSKEWEEKRRQNIEKMNEEMERIAEYERGQRADGDKPSRNFLDDPRRSGPAPDIDRKEGSRRHVRNWGGLDFDNVKTGADLEKEWSSRRPGPKGSVDMTMSMTGRERAEYLRWKKEREQIDEERLARHRNATGQWRREWDAQKTDNMFKEDTCASTESGTAETSSKRDDNKRPPKGPTFGDFLSQGRTPGSRGDRARGRGRGQKPDYSMHDNRWEAEENNRDCEEEEDEWVDASDGDDEMLEEGSESDHNSRDGEKKDKGKEK
uniref:Coiled-coil domain containing 9 n=1 Tax=Tetraodon nigroviridis TaxID=99883 RepID=H3CMV9_TETNG